MVQCSQAICTKASCSPSLTDEGLHDRLFLPNCSSSLAARDPHQAIPWLTTVRSGLAKTRMAANHRLTRECQTANSILPDSDFIDSCQMYSTTVILQNAMYTPNKNRQLYQVTTPSRVARTHKIYYITPTPGQ